MFRLGKEENEYILCPYDKVHKIRKARMQVHLVKCRKNHPSAEVATCPFNVLHIVNKLELDFHISVCPERLSFELFCHQENPPANSNSTITEELSAVSAAEKSAWDEEEEVPTYNPSSYVQKAAVLRNAQGMTPSQRREFRAKERERLLNIAKKQTH